MAEQFFAGYSARVFSTSEQLSLLSGPPACGKTSLLFQFAFNCAAESYRNVVFICNKKRLEFKPPFLSLGMDLASPVFSRIQMKYVENDAEIKKYFAAFHLFESFPSAVIIDDFGDFFTKGLKLKPGGSCKLLFSDTQIQDNTSLFFLYKIWIKSIFIIEGGGTDSFFLKNMSNQNNGPTRRIRTAKYSITGKYLILEEMLED